MSVWMLWKGILLGLGAAVPIGPVNVEIARRCLRQGFMAGFLVGCGAVTVDISYAILAAFSLRPFFDYPVFLTVLGFTGVLLLAYLGIGSLASAIRSYKNPLPSFQDEAPPPRHRHYVTGLLMTALNPMTLAFWFVVVPAMAGKLSSQPRRDLPFLCAGVFLGAFSWVCSFSSLMSLARRINKRTTLIVADAVGGIMLLGFAAYALYQTILTSNLH